MPKRPPAYRPPTARPAPDRRASAARRGYGRAHRRLRRAFLSANPLCVDCLAIGRITAATDLDHIVPLAAGGTNEETNFAARCRACHARKTAIEDGGFGRRTKHT